MKGRKLSHIQSIENLVHGVGNDSDRKIFVVSNRLPFSYDKKSGKISRGTGGLVSALLAYKPHHPMIWVGAETDHDSAQALQKWRDGFELSPVLVETALYNKYYDEFCNDVIWPLFHYEGDLVLFNREAWKAYEEVNRLFAESIARLASTNDLIWIHDFHLMLVPHYLKKINPNLKVGFFLHIPFPSSEIYRQLPVRETLLKGLLSADLIGFHEYSYLRHFTLSVKAQLGVDASFFGADFEGRRVRLGVYPISVDAEQIKERAFTPEVDVQKNRYSHRMPEAHFILGVDRLDYSKGIELKLEGLSRAFKKYPELQGRVTLVQVAVPTRTRVPAYARLKKRIDQLVGKINGEFGRPDYMPVRYVFSSVSETELFALYRMADSLLVTSKRDGMNLVCMEYILSQEPEAPGTVILSEFAGASSLLSQATLINPWDSDSIADAIKLAYDRSHEERIQVHRDLYSTLSRYSASDWGRTFLTDLDNVKPTTPTITIPDLANHHWPKRLRESTSGGKTYHVILDYDGTITPIKDRPDLVHLSSETRDVIRQLSELENVKVCIVSGRPRSYLWKELEGLKVHVAAEHGAFFRSHEGDPWTTLLTSDLKVWYREAERVMADYAERVPHAFIEKKEASISWHYRLSPAGFAEYQAKKLGEELEVCLANLPSNILLGSKVVEARAVECNKGDFVRWYSRSFLEPNDRIIAIGDDRTDEDMFKANIGRGTTIKVGLGATNAQFRILHQKFVDKFLLQLFDWIRNEESKKSPLPKVSRFKAEEAQI